MCGITGWVPGLQRIQMDIDGLGTMLVLASVQCEDNGYRDTGVFIPRTLLMRGAQDKQIGLLYCYYYYYCIDHSFVENKQSILSDAF